MNWDFELSTNVYYINEAMRRFFFVIRALAGYVFFSCNNRNLHTSRSHKEIILLFIFTSLDIDYVIYYEQNTLDQ